MWFLSILVLFNAFANNDTVVNKYRIELGVPVNIFDVLIVIGFGIALIRPLLGGKFYQTDRVHGALMWLMGLFSVALLVGFIGASVGDAQFVRVLTAARNLMSIPASIYLGYFLISHVGSARWFLHVSVWAGVIASFMVLFFFKSQGESMNALSSSAENIRATAYISAYAGLATGLLFYSVASGNRLYPMPVALLLAGWCLIGQFFTLSRSDWLATLCAFVAVYFVLPRERRGRSFVTAIVASPVLLVCLYFGLWGASKITRQDMLAKMYTRIESMLPGHQAGVKFKAWDSRLPGMQAEIKVFMSNPLLGGGLAVQDSSAVDDVARSSTRHCSWTAAAAEQGVMGIAAAGMMIFGTAVVSRRIMRTPVEPKADRTFALVGAFGIVATAYYAMHGATTMSWNQMRYGLPLFIAVGVVLRTRAMQLTYQRQLAEYAEASYTQDALAYEDQQPGYVTEEPVFGNWYQTN